ncbi:hypothetical protein AB0F17_41745 [Nonomuraea sp. NPDC026600]|uniref:hypothetical protein n=1 Tax=Nonomuraea sp. NPDC026600 TaxID=3155363 RepID=UPI0033EB6C77
MFGTAARQMGYAWSMLAGRRFRVKDVAALVDDLRATLEEFGSPGEGAGEMLTAPDPEMQRDLAARRLRRTVRSTARDTPYYRRWFEQHGIDPGSITLNSLASIEPTTKAALRDLPSAFVADRARPAVLAQTTGTTGVPTMVWFSRYEIDLMSGMSGMSGMALMLAGGLRPQHVWANCITSRSIAQILIERAVTMTGAAFFHLGVVDPRATLDRLAVPLHVPGKRPHVTHLNTTSHHGLNRAEIREMLMSWKPNALTDYATATTAIANGLVEVAHGIVFRAQEIRDAPWHGPAADKAQGALQSIFETVRGLASVHGDMGLRTTECAEILISAQHRFDAVVNKGGWEISDLWGGDDKDAAEFLTGVNRQLGDVMRRLPGAAQLGLPGLIPEPDRATYSLAWY